mgnify:CR=1 FL=1
MVQYKIVWGNPLLTVMASYCAYVLPLCFYPFSYYYPSRVASFKRPDVSCGSIPVILFFALTGNRAKLLCRPLAPSRVIFIAAVFTNFFIWHASKSVVISWYPFPMTVPIEMLVLLHACKITVCRAKLLSLLLFLWWVYYFSPTLFANHCSVGLMFEITSEYLSAHVFTSKFRVTIKLFAASSILALSFKSRTREIVDWDSPDISAISLNFTPDFRICCLRSSMILRKFIEQF